MRLITPLLPPIPLCLFLLLLILVLFLRPKVLRMVSKLPTVPTFIPCELATFTRLVSWAFAVLAIRAVIRFVICNQSRQGFTSTSSRRGFHQVNGTVRTVIIPVIGPVGTNLVFLA